MNQCLAPDCQMGGLGCDNMTVILICYLNAEPYEKLAEKCKLAPLPLSQCSHLNNSLSFSPNCNSPIATATALTRRMVLEDETN